MAVHHLQQGQITRPKQKVLQAARLPAPIKGIDARVAMSQSSIEHCNYCINLISYEYGMKTRKGYREYSVPLDNGEAAGVRAVIPYDGVNEDGSGDRLFAVTNEGIWNVTTPEVPPVFMYEFTHKDGDAGYGVYSHYILSNGEGILFFADKRNGLLQYNPSTGDWTLADIQGGVAAENVRFVVVHKQRVWVTEEASTTGYYLPVGSPSGNAEAFNFGAKFAHGGQLAGVFSWSVDGGAGVDDMFVAVSSAGDVLVYQGEDPSSADTWSMKGVYFIGHLPETPYFGSEHGGELFLLSTAGLIGMNDLLVGGNALDTERNTLSSKITGLLRLHMENSRQARGWGVKLIPGEGALLVSSPPKTSILASKRTLQYFYNFAVGAWSVWRDVPILCFDSWRGRVVFGSENNRVYYMDSQLDDVRLNPDPDKPVNGDPIEFSILSSYTDFGSPATFKRVSYIRADFSGVDVPNAAQKIFYDFALQSHNPPLAKEGYPTGGWDFSDWDAAIWGADRGLTTGINAAYGGWGQGRHVAVALTGYTYYELRFFGWDILFDVGGEMP